MSISFLGSNLICKKNLGKLINCNDKKEATALSLWERFIDLFRLNKKAEVLDTFYTLISRNSSFQVDMTHGNKFYHFEQLKHLAHPVHRSLFTIDVRESSKNENVYVFLIDGIEISILSNSTGWDTISGITYNNVSLVKNYSEIIRNYINLNLEDFKQEYPDTALKECYGADEILDYSCYFLKNNAGIREALLNHGLVNCDMLDHISTEMRGRDGLEDDMIGNYIYTLQTMMGTIRVLEKFDGDYI